MRPGRVVLCIESRNRDARSLSTADIQSERVAGLTLISWPKYSLRKATLILIQGSFLRGRTRERTSSRGPVGLIPNGILLAEATRSLCSHARLTSARSESGRIRKDKRNFMKRIFALTLMIVLSQSSCIVAGGYRSGGGWFLWPGGLLGLLVIVVLFLLLRRRR
jgi:hypothetical protein